ncbi:TetR family transcriptional regulator [Catellatospora sp. NPDC049609]|uniref:TetR family transcriptional regulator n=1 Tax=Catellatospora sp. NPDC049609 TaxID=3155505 RepID=UPI0034375177
MADAPLTPDRILEAAEEALRRYGPAKANVVDVARALNVSHGSVYRHFPSKAALRNAVVERWLARLSAPLGEIAAERGPAEERLRRWLDALSDSKQRMARDEPELFATYYQLALEADGVVAGHVSALSAQLGEIIADGVGRGEFTVGDPFRMGRAVFDATGRFHNPAYLAEWSDPDIKSAFEGVWLLIRNGLGVPGK